MSKEAMKLALETLEVWKGYMPAVWDKTDEQAITALRQALANEALDKMAENARALGLDYEPAQQEPVAWRNAALRVGEDLCSVGPFGYYDMTAEQWLDWALSVVTVHAPPAQRTWVGLTDEERKLVRNSVGYNQFVTAGEYAEHVQKATEFKLLEKNNG